MVFGIKSQHILLTHHEQFTFQDCFESNALEIIPLNHSPGVETLGGSVGIGTLIKHSNQGLK